MEMQKDCYKMLSSVAEKLQLLLAYYFAVNVLSDHKWRVILAINFSIWIFLSYNINYMLIVFYYYYANEQYFILKS